MLNQQFSLDSGLLALGFKQEHIDILKGYKALFCQDLTDMEFYKAVENTNKVISIHKDFGGFMKVLKYYIEEVRKEIYSTYNFRAIGYMRSQFIEAGMEYEQAQTLIKYIRKAQLKISPYDTINYVKLLYTPDIDFQDFVKKVLMALAEINLNLSNSRSIVFKYQTPPYIITQQELEKGIELAIGNSIAVDKQHYQRIKEFVDNSNIPDSELFEKLISNKYLDSYVKLEKILPYVDKIDIRSFVTAILYVASGGKTTDVKNMF